MVTDVCTANGNAIAGTSFDLNRVGGFVLQPAGQGKQNGKHDGITRLDMINIKKWGAFWLLEFPVTIRRVSITAVNAVVIRRRGFGDPMVLTRFSCVHLHRTRISKQGTACKVRLTSFELTACSRSGVIEMNSKTKC